jgi:hypothetical protein
MIIMDKMDTILHRLIRLAGNVINVIFKGRNEITTESPGGIETAIRVIKLHVGNGAKSSRIQMMIWRRDRSASEKVINR